jgi:hypothetical protein
MEQFIKNTWQKGKAVSALFLNIQAAFPNMSKNWLLENMQVRNIAPEYCNYVQMILMQCQIQLKFDNYTSTPENGCNQGCPLSMLLYALYNTPLIHIADSNNPNECIVGFVNDTTLLASGDDLDETHQALKDMMEHKNRVFEWSRTYNSPLEMNKLALIDFMLSHKKANNAKTLALTQKVGNNHLNHHIKPSPNAKLLGVILDSRLTWAAQHKKVCEKAVKWTMAFKQFTKTASGIAMNEARKLYNAITIPKICYTSDIWYHPKGQDNTSKNPKRYSPSTLTKCLEAIQCQAAISITGALQTSPGDVTIRYANLTPIGMLLKEASHKAYACITTHPQQHPLYPIITCTAKHQVKRHQTALHCLAKQAIFKPNKIEKINPSSPHPEMTPKITTTIASTREESTKDDKDEFKKDIMIYTDRSGTEGMIGSSSNTLLQWHEALRAILPTRATNQPHNIQG